MRKFVLPSILSPRKPFSFLVALHQSVKLSLTPSEKPFARTDTYLFCSTLKNQIAEILLKQCEHLLIFHGLSSLISPTQAVSLKNSMPLSQRLLFLFGQCR